MDRYIDEFCERHFSDFERLGNSNANEALFDNPRMRPNRYLWIVLLVALVLIISSFFVSSSFTCKSNLMKELGVGVLASALVALWFDLRARSICYYEKLCSIIELRIDSIRAARSEANEHLVNVDAAEGLQLLQFTAQNAYELAGYLEDKLSSSFRLAIVDGIVVKRDLFDCSSESEEQEHIRVARQTIQVLLRRLNDAKISIKMYAYGERMTTPVWRGKSRRKNVACLA